MQRMALEEPLSIHDESFKLDSASVQLTQPIGTIKGHHLLIAYFELCNETFPIVVDTGATISCLPERGVLMTKYKFARRAANLNVQMANNGIIHMPDKVEVPIRPTGAECEPVLTTFYVARGEKNIIGYEALVGLEQLKLFDLQIRFSNGKVHIFSQGRDIGHESPALKHIKCSIIVDNRFDNLKNDPNILHIVRRYKKVFADIGPEPIYGKPMRFYTTHQRPIFAKQRHYSPEEIVQMKQHINSLLEKGIIEPTCSGYAATSRIIPKKTGDGRLVVNYIPLNAVTLRDSYALPHIQDILNVLQGKRFFTTMDCAQGFYQILVDVRDRHKTAFSTPIGNFQFVRCPFGARNSCAVFQAEMNRIFAGGLYTRCVVYVDDIIVFGSTKQEHDDNLLWVLSRCARFNVKIKFEKCHFAQLEVDYLGFRVSGTTIKPQKDKISTLCGSRPPESKTELRSIIGKLNFYARFVPNYSKQLEPMRELLTKNREYCWRPHHQRALVNLLKSLEAEPEQILASRSTDKIIELHIMKDSIEALCLDENERIVCRISRFLAAAEANYSVIEKQLLALVLALKRFKYWLHPEKFVVRVPTNGLEKTLGLVHKPERVENLLLQMPPGFDLFKLEVKESLMQKPGKKVVIDHLPEEVYYVDGACKANGKANCKACWAVCAEYDRDLQATGFVEDSPSNNTAELMAGIKACEIAKERNQKAITIITDSKYLYSSATSWIDKWKSNEWTDYKKKPLINTELFKRLLIAKDGLQVEWIHVKGHADNGGNIRADLLAKSCIDEQSATICALAKGKFSIQDDSEEIQQLKQQILSNRRDDFIIGDDSLVYYNDLRDKENETLRIYVPESSRSYLLNLAHDSELYGGHLGIKKCERKLSRFYWPNMRKSIEEYISHCDLCQRFKDPRGPPKGLLNSIPVSKIFEHLHIDLVGPLKRTQQGNTHIITATDAFSKWAFAKPCLNITAAGVIKFLEDNIIALHGKPETIITDRGTQFTSHEWARYMEKMSIQHNLTSGYHPQSNGIDERLNGTLIRILLPYVDENQLDWDDKLKWALFVYNTTAHSSTGFSPYQILHGLTSRSPFNANSIEIDNHEEIDKIRTTIRQNADSVNKKAQYHQKDNYDRGRKECEFEVGDLVLVREQTTPSDMSKKLYPKWYGPCVITSILGDDGTRRALQIFDSSILKKKPVALEHVKPYKSSLATKTNSTTQEERGDTRQAQSGNNQTAGDFINFDEPSDEPDKLTTTHLSDLVELDNDQPISSSPRRTTMGGRRVTINEQVDTFRYNTETDNNSNGASDPPDEISSLIEPIEGDHAEIMQYTDKSIVSEATVEAPNSAEETATEIYQSDTENQSSICPQINPQPNYILPNIIDDSIRDPTYKPPERTPEQPIVTPRVTRSRARCNPSIAPRDIWTTTTSPSCPQSLRPKMKPTKIPRLIQSESETASGQPENNTKSEQVPTANNETKGASAEGTLINIVDSD